MSIFKEKAMPIAEKIMAKDFESAYAIYFQAMKGGIAACPLDMIDFAEEIESQINNPDTWEEWEEWTWERESTRTRN